MKILLFGADGQLGRQLRRSLCVLGEVIPLTRGSQPLCGDLLHPRQVAASVATVQPDLVVNAAAWTDVDGAERDPDSAHAVNATAVAALAGASAEAGCWFAHVSTDYVHDGSGDRPWREDDPERPLSAYGRSKLAGEQAAMEATRLHLVLRTGWLFEPGHRNFVTTVLRAARTRETLDVVDDQWGSPTRAALVADVLAHMVRSLRREADPARLAGLYQVSAAGATNRFGCATATIEAARAAGLPLRLTKEGLRPVASAAAAGAAPRPLNCRLDTGKLQHAFGLHLPPWEDGVRDAIGQIARVAGWSAA